MLPYSSPNDVKLFANEYVNSNTINRALLRLFYNDTYMANLSSLSPVDTPLVANSLLVSIGDGEYTWMNGAEVKTALGITDALLGLSDVSASELTIENNQGLVWNAATADFISKDFVSALNDLSDVTVSSPTNLQSLVYSDEYGKWINSYPSDFAVGYIASIMLETDGKVILPAVTQPGQQVQIVKYGTTTDAYVVPDTTNPINGQVKALVSNNSDEETSSIHIRSILMEDESIEWVMISGDGTWDFIDSGTVPGSGIEIRNVSGDDLMLAPYDVTIENVPDATEITKGIIRIATYAEGIAGVLNDVCVTPYQLKYYMDNYIIPFANDTEFKTGTDDTKAATIVQIHSMDDAFFELTTGSEDLAQTINGDWEYFLDDFTGPDTDGITFDKTQIRGVWIEVIAGTSTSEANVTATWPTGTPQAIGSVEAYGSGDTARVRQTTLVPINRGQTSFNVAQVIGGGAWSEFTIIGVQQRVFE